jgi:ribosome maturation factor RimP
MSGSSRRGSARPSAVGSRPGAGDQPASQPDGGRNGSARNDGGRNDGGRNGGARNDGARSGGSRRGSSVRNDAARNGAPRSAPPRPAGPAIDADRVAGLLTPVIEALDMDLEAVRVTAAGRRRLLRLVIDADGGVGLDEIAVVSREVSAALDESPLMGEQPYTLEVSSPGVDRPLTERRHWRRAIGRLVVVPLAGAAAAPVSENGDGGEGDGDADTVEGRIMGASGDGVTLEIAGQSRQFGYGDLGPGKIKIEFARLGAAGDDEDIDDEGSGEDTDEEGSDGY